MEKAYFNIINLIYKPYQQTIFKLYQKLKSFQKLYDALKIKEKIDLEKEYEKVERLGIKILTIDDDNYPEQLRNIDEPPLGFYLLGEIDLSFPIAIVGTRRASSYGKNIARKFSEELSKLGITIISGLAFGIDEMAHRGAIEFGKTIAVLGEGIDLALNSPKRNLIDKILEKGGGIISEYSLGTPGLKPHFPLRNRIIAGLSNGIVIIEAPINSGALITANYGLKYGKEIFVVPGEITNKNFEGSHNLIKQGARLVTSIEDILSEFDFDIKKKEKVIRLNLTPKEEIIYELLKIEPLTLDEISIKTKMNIQDILTILTHMEVRGIIKNIEGRFYLE
ncbi:MAG: DNA-processing protein DprA [Minisyncoccia bacterium]